MGLLLLQNCISEYRHGLSMGEKLTRTSRICASVLVGIVLTMGAVWMLHEKDSNYLNFKYLLWKTGMGSYESSYSQHVISDVRFRQKLQGKEISKVKEYFPYMQPLKSSEYQELSTRYPDRIVEGDYYWIDVQTRMTMLFRNGKMQNFDLWKG